MDSKNKKAPVMEWPIERMALADLNPAEYNPRSISEKNLAGLTSSIEKFGMVEPIVWNKRTGKIVGGHQRHKVLSEAGVKETDVVVIDLDESEEVALNITLNNPHIQGDFADNLKDVLEQVEPDAEFGELRLDELLNKLVREETDLSGSLGRKFIIAPFSVIDATNQLWVDRQTFWHIQDIRPENAIYGDPVLCELMMTWFSPVGAKVLGPSKSVWDKIAVACSREVVNLDSLGEEKSDLLLLEYSADNSSLNADMVEAVADDRFIVVLPSTEMDELKVVDELTGLGLIYYNEFMLWQEPSGISTFVKNRRLEVCHQKILTFIKGSTKGASVFCGEKVIVSEVSSGE